MENLVLLWGANVALMAEAVALARNVVVMDAHRSLLLVVGMQVAGREVGIPHYILATANKTL